MADHAFILKLGAIVITDNDVDIPFEGEPYLANDSLYVVEDVPETAGSIPEVLFSVICPVGSPQYLLLSSDPGPIECVVRFVEYVPSEWQKRWEFMGILSEGSMNNYLYTGRIEHIISWKIRSRRPVMWTNSAQQAAHPGDKGLEYVHEIQDIRSSIKWNGINA